MDGVVAVRRLAVGDLVALAKPGLTRMVVMTTGLGLLLADAPVGLRLALCTVLGTTLVVASANAFNSLIERHSDALMARTRGRPLAAGRLSPEVAWVYGVALGLGGLALLAFGAGPLPAALAALAHGSYVLVYTPLKRRTWLATIVGAVPGALPPVIGWSAATGTIGLGGAALFLLLFAWQLPHFFAIAIFRRGEYAGAGIRVHPLVHGEARTRRQMLVLAALLIPASLSLFAVGVAGLGYALVAALAGGGFLWLVARGALAERCDDGWARKVFHGSLVHLTALMILLLVERFL